MLGYIAFVGILFLPGLATVLLLRREQGGTVSLLALSYGLSLVLNSLIGFANFFLGLATSDLALLELGGSILALLLISVLRYRHTVFTGIEGDLRHSLPVFLVAVVTGALILSEFLKYPVFPKSFSEDFIQHAKLVDSALAGGPGNISWSLLYGGVHLNLALGVALAGGITMVQLPVLMALLTVPSSFVFYEVCRLLYGSRGHALLAQGLYAITGFVWYVPLYDSGLYPNLYGTILSLFYIILLLKYRESPSLRNYLLLLIATSGLFLSHYSVALFVAAVDGYLLLRLAMKKEPLRFVAGAVVANVGPGLGFLVLYPGFLGLAANFLGYSGPAGTFGFSTPLADALSSSAFLHFVVAEIYSYEDVVVLLFTLPVAAYYLLSNRNKAPFLPLVAVWLLVLWVTAPQNDLTWRFSNQALAPIVLLAPASFATLSRVLVAMVGRPEAKRGKRGGRSRRGWGITGQAVATAVILLVVFSGSWANAMLADLTTDTSTYSSAQTDLYNSMTWFNQNTPAQSALLSVTDWRIAFMHQLNGRLGESLIFANATQAVSYAKSNGFGYVLVTYLIPADVPVGFDAVSFYNSFSNDPGLRQVYSNPTDVIYQLVS